MFSLLMVQWLMVFAILSLFKPQHSLARQSDAGQQGRLYKVYTSIQKSGGFRAVTELPGHALIAAGLGPLVNVSVLVEHSTLRGQLGEVSVQGDLHTSDDVRLRMRVRQVSVETTTSSPELRPWPLPVPATPASGLVLTHSDSLKPVTA